MEFRELQTIQRILHKYGLKYCDMCGEFKLLKIDFRYYHHTSRKGVTRWRYTSKCSLCMKDLALEYNTTRNEKNRKLTAIRKAWRKPGAILRLRKMIEEEIRNANTDYRLRT